MSNITYIDKISEIDLENIRLKVIDSTNKDKDKDNDNTIQPINNNEYTINQETSDITQQTPLLIFVIPYRDREQQLYFFTTHMSLVLEPYLSDGHIIDVLFVHQNDKRVFNRGALKNIGYIYSCEKYGKSNCDNITFVFHDLDIMPYKSYIIDYDLKNVIKSQIINGKMVLNDKIVKHFYGFTHALGGLFSIKGRIFNLIGGFPNLWGWGYEDNCIASKCDLFGVEINRDEFYKIFNDNFIYIHNGSKRVIDKNNVNFIDYVTKNCIHNIQQLNYVERNNDVNFNKEMIELVNTKHTGKLMFKMIDVNKFIVDNKYDLKNITKMSSLNHRITVPKKKLNYLKDLSKKIQNNDTTISKQVNKNTFKATKPVFEPVKQTHNKSNLKIDTQKPQHINKSIQKHNKIRKIGMLF